MVIIDTSVWIEFFKGNQPYYKEVLSLIENRTARTIQPIFGELYQGALSNRERTFISKFWESIFKIEDSELMINAGLYSSVNKLVSKGVKLIDASIIYTAAKNSCTIWTLDKKLLNALDKKYVY
jgi:predicted nucleic acid-binding protein